MVQCNGDPALSTPPRRLGADGATVVVGPVSAIGEHHYSCRRNTKRCFRALFVAISSFVCSTYGVSAEHDDSMADPAMREQVLAAGGAVFDAVFASCNAAALETLVAGDFEFYHDKSGVVTKSGRQFVQSVADMCAHPGEWRSRRELVKDSVEIYPIEGYGAMEIGVHRFYERKLEQPERLAGIAKFSHVWKRENGQWKLSRVLSYGHQTVK